GELTCERSEHRQADRASAGSPGGDGCGAHPHGHTDVAGDLEALLVVQELDLAADQLRHRRATLPARVQAGGRRAELDGIERSVATVGQRRQELVRSQTRLEDEIEMVRDKAGQVDRTLYGGSVRNPRELMDLQEELSALGRRQRSLEDHELEIMEELEPIEAELASLDGDRASARDDLERLEAELATSEAEIDAELAELAERRLAAMAPVSAEVLDEYERLRASFGGIGVARLIGSSCTGCHLTLPAVEVDQIRRGEAGTMVHCSQCGRLLVP
ncbi:MAG: zinc ribbon domain-containing protein, partial [Acidimicrobiales bacterium]